MGMVSYTLTPDEGMTPHVTAGDTGHVLIGVVSITLTSGLPASDPLAEVRPQILLGDTWFDLGSEITTAPTLRQILSLPPGMAVRLNSSVSANVEVVVRLQS